MIIFEYNESTPGIFSVVVVSTNNTNLSNLCGRLTFMKDEWEKFWKVFINTSEKEFQFINKGVKE